MVGRLLAFPRALFWCCILHDNKYLTQYALGVYMLGDAQYAPTMAVRVRRAEATLSSMFDAHLELEEHNLRMKQHATSTGDFVLDAASWETTVADVVMKTLIGPFYSLETFPPTSRYATN